jgi:hypothetical protein
MNSAPRIVLRAVVVWAILMVAETIHGVLRAIFLVPLVGDFRARQIGVFTGSVLLLGIVFLLIQWVRAVTPGALLAVGFLWLAMTLLFEFGAGHFVFGRSWEALFSDYNVAQGGLLPFGLAVLAFSPLIAARARGIHKGARGK